MIAVGVGDEVQLADLRAVVAVGERSWLTGVRSDGNSGPLLPTPVDEQ